MDNDNKQTLNIFECREAIEIMSYFTAPGMLNRAEYKEILIVLEKCGERLMKERDTKKCQST